MPEIHFSHSAIANPLTVSTGANQIAWAYGVNTQSYPTYGGEVVQILSTYIDNITVEGEVRTVAELEKIYSWFIEYLQKATQGTAGTRYSQESVTMTYPHRGWALEIQPTQLPGFSYGTEIVASSYSIQAAVVEPDPEMILMSDKAAELGKFAKLTADIGFDEQNPFSDPKYASIGEKKFLHTTHEQQQDTSKSSSQDDAHASLNKAADFYNKLVSNYGGHKFEDWPFANISGPASPKPTTKSGQSTQTRSGKAK